MDWRELLLVQKAMLLVIYSRLPDKMFHLANQIQLYGQQTLNEEHFSALW